MYIHYVFLHLYNVLYLRAQNFVCHTKGVASVPSHHQPAKGSSIVLPPSIIPRKSTVLPPLISPPAHADLPSHVSSRTIDQPREEASCLCHQSVHPHPLEVALCRRCQSYWEKALCRHRWSVRPCPLICRCTSVAKSSTSQEKKHCYLPSISLLAPASLQSYVLAAPSSSGEIKRRVAAFDHCLWVHHCGISAVDQPSHRAHIAQLTKFSSQITEKNSSYLRIAFAYTL